MCVACASAWRVDPRVTSGMVQTQVPPPAGAVRSRRFVSDGPLRRGSFALGTGRSPEEKAACALHVQAPGGSTHG